MATVLAGDESGRLALYRFELVDVLGAAGVPCTAGVLQIRAYKRLVGRFLRL